MTENQSYSEKRKDAGTGFMISGILAILAITTATAIYPTYSVRNDAISYLGGEGVPTELFWNTMVVIVGIAWLWSTYRLFRGSGKKFGPVMFGLTGIGFLLVGLSPWDQYPLTHYLGANSIFLFGFISCFIGSRMTAGSMSRISVVCGALSLFGYLSGYIGGANLLGSGGVERMIFYPILLWSIGFGGYLASLSQNGIDPIAGSVR